jgi:hypothetical protein
MYLFYPTIIIGYIAYKMRKQIITFSQVLLLLFCIETSIVKAQVSAQFEPTGSSVIIKGTSNLHDWEETIEKFSVDAVFIIQNKKITDIERLAFTCKSSAIKSESSIMTSKTHDAMKSDKHPNIKFTGTKPDHFQQTGSSISGNISGDLSIAGVVRSISLPFNGTYNADQLIITGSKKLKMTDFNISPPTAILGSLKTDENIEVIYKLKLQF